MKPLPLVLVAVMSVASVRSQEQDSAAPVAPNRTIAAPVAPTIIPTTARIIGNIPDGTPPLPTPPKPAFVVPTQDVLATTTHQQGGRTITIQRIKPIALPPPPEPAQPLAQLDDAAFQARVAAFQANHPR